LLRFLHTISIVAVLVSALVLYGVNFQTRRVEADVQARERQLEKLQAEIQVLRTDYALMSSPTSIEKAARRLGLEPATGRKAVTPQALPVMSDRPAPEAAAILSGQQ
jgi:cell division protein FtsL